MTSPKLPYFILLDEIRLRQILFNLVGNAIKFTKKGSIKLSFMLLKKEAKTIDFEISVEDTGIGIPENQQKEIFKAFKQQVGQSTRKYGGTGLGLTISRKLVESMDGKISVESIVNKFAKFSVVFSNVQITKSDKNSNTKKNKEEYNIEFESACILVIDRVKENIDLIKANFSNTPVTIIAASNAEIALDLIKSKTIDLIILDISISDIKNCKLDELNSQILKNGSPQVIAMSTSIINKEKCAIEINFADYLSKPMKRADLILSVSKFLKHKKVHLKKQKNEQVDIDNTLKKIQLKPEFNEIIKQIDEKLIPIWEKTVRDELSDDIELFSKEIKSFAEKYKIDILIKFANNLSDQLNSFDLEEMNKSLKIFPNIIKKIKN